MIGLPELVILVLVGGVAYFAFTTWRGRPKSGGATSSPVAATKARVSTGYRLLFAGFVAILLAQVATPQGGLAEFVPLLFWGGILAGGVGLVFVAIGLSKT